MVAGRNTGSGPQQEGSSGPQPQQPRPGGGGVSGGSCAPGPFQAPAPPPPQKQFSRNQRGVCPPVGASASSWRCCHETVLLQCPDPALHVGALRADLAETEAKLASTPHDSVECESLEARRDWATRFIHVSRGASGFRPAGAQGSTRLRSDAGSEGSQTL